MEKLISLFGLFVMVAIAYVFSEKKNKIKWRLVFSGVVIQFFFAVVILKTAPGQYFFEGAKDIFTNILSFTDEGSRFVFGELTNNKKIGFVFFTMVLPTIVFMSSFMSILYHVGIMQILVKLFAKVMMKVMRTSGAESLAAAANIFAGQTEAALVVKPFIPTMTRSELFSLMTGGMATVAGGIMAAYVGLGIDAGHLLAASVMSAPAALVCAKMMIPESQKSTTENIIDIKLEKTTVNLIDAAATGAADGVKLAINVAAMLLAFIALIALLNGFLGFTGGFIGIPHLTLEMIMGYLFAPIAWLMGIPWNECEIVGALLGKKLVINEFVAYLDLKEQLLNLSPRSITITTYALCGFANFSSIAIQVGGIGVLAPSRRKDLAELGMKSLMAGTLACFMTACVAGILL